MGNAFAINIADVEVDPDTGKVEVLRFTAIQDCGKAIHPSYVEGQIQGGAVQGIGWALNEEYFFNDSGEMMNSSFLDYRMPTALDLPMIDTVIVEVPNPGHPLGVRGVGEVSLVPPMAAIGNAIARATGARLESLPMNPARCWKRCGSRTAGSPRLCGGACVRFAASLPIASSRTRRLTLMVARHIAAGEGGLPRPESSGLPGAEIDYPSSDGEPMAESERQLIPMAGTFFILRDWFRDRPDVYIGCDLLIYYREGDNGVRWRRTCSPCSAPPAITPGIPGGFGKRAKRPTSCWKSRRPAPGVRISPGSGRFT